MLFTITSWIIVFTLIGILAVCVFRALCEPAADPNKTYSEKPAETNHYEPLNHELKRIEAAETSAAETENPGESVKEALLVDVKAVEPAVSEEEKPLNTQALDNPEVLQEVKVTTAVVEPSGVALPVDTVVIETQQRSQAVVSSTVSTVSAVTVHNNVETSPTPSPKVVLSEVTATAAVPIPEPLVEHQAVRLESPAETPAPPIDVIVSEQQNINEIPVPYSEVENATLPRLNGPLEATVKASVLPA